MWNVGGLQLLDLFWCFWYSTTPSQMLFIQNLWYPWTLFHMWNRIQEPEMKKTTIKMNYLTQFWHLKQAAAIYLYHNTSAIFFVVIENVQKFQLHIELLHEPFLNVKPNAITKFLPLMWGCIFFISKAAAIFRV